MANDEKLPGMTDKALEGKLDDAPCDTTLELDDELANLFAAFDDVSASDELQEATMARILAAAGDKAIESAPAETETSLPTETQIPATIAANPPETPASIKAVAGDSQRKADRRAKWRAIRVAALAACLTLALTGGVAYATPATYYEVAQGQSTVTLGVNCFGVTVSAVADDETSREVVESADLCNVPYEESLARTIERMEEHDPTSPVEFGPRGGERETIEPRGPAPEQPAEPERADQPAAPDNNGGSAGGNPGPGSAEAPNSPNSPNAPNAPSETDAPRNPEPDPAAQPQNSGPAQASRQPSVDQPQGVPGPTGAGEDAGQPPSPPVQQPVIK